MEECKLPVESYTGEEIPVMGQLYVDVRHQQNKFVNLRMVILKGHGVNLVGREWLTKIKLNWNNVMTCSSSVINEVNKLLDRQSNLIEAKRVNGEIFGFILGEIGKSKGAQGQIEF